MIMELWKKPVLVEVVRYNWVNYQGGRYVYYALSSRTLVPLLEQLYREGVREVYVTAVIKRRRVTMLMTVARKNGTYVLRGRGREVHRLLDEVYSSGKRVVVVEEVFVT
jgi:hypothetical protein